MARRAELIVRDALLNTSSKAASAVSVADFLFARFDELASFWWPSSGDRLLFGSWANTGILLNSSLNKPNSLSINSPKSLSCWRGWPYLQSEIWPERPCQLFPLDSYEEGLQMNGRQIGSALSISHPPFTYINDADVLSGEAGHI